MYYGRKYHTNEELVKAVIEYIDYYTNERPQRGFGIQTPKEYYEQLPADRVGKIFSHLSHHRICRLASDSKGLKKEMVYTFSYRISISNLNTG